MKKKEVFIIGSKGIPAKYGGFETFVEQLTRRKEDSKLHYNVACRRDLSDIKEDFFEYNGATCFNIDVPSIGPASAVAYDVKALKFVISYIKKKKIRNPIVYVLACRIGPFIGYFKKQLAKCGGTLFVNPDGHEWLRAKWSYPIRRYWRLSERLMVKHADLLICDSKSIEKYIQNDYKKYSPRTTYIAYGSDVTPSELKADDLKVSNWYSKYDISLGKYYLIVGRFVPENNYETMIQEFLASKTDKSLVIVSNVEKNSFYNKLEQLTDFENDDRIKFVGTVYDTQLLKFIRENAYAYLHGHEVGGTNPSLLEALGSTEINLLLDVGFNHEVGLDGALYWNKKKGSLASLINATEKITLADKQSLSVKAKQRIIRQFDWRLIVRQYEDTFDSI